MQGLLDSLGPVYEKILNDVGILTLHDLVEMSKDPEEKAIVVASLQEKNPAITVAKVDGWIKDAKELIDAD